MGRIKQIFKSAASQGCKVSSSMKIGIVDLKLTTNLIRNFENAQFYIALNLHKPIPILNFIPNLYENLLLFL